MNLNASQHLLGEARAIAKEAYIYGCPLVEAYRMLYAWFVNELNPFYKGPWNTFIDLPYPSAPGGLAWACPDTDTLRSVIGLDLRSEPLVLCVPAMEAGRYLSIQCIDAWTHNFAYLGSRSTGHGGGIFLIAGPGWRGETPADVTQALRCETEFGLAMLRMQIVDAADMAGAQRQRQDCSAQTLSAFLHQPAPPAAAARGFVRPPAPGEHIAAPEWFSLLGFLMNLCHPHASEALLMRRFARIGLRAGAGLVAPARSAEMQAALDRGIADAKAESASLLRRLDAKELAAADLHGCRESLAHNYLFRMTGAVAGIFQDSPQEAMSWTYHHDADGNRLLGSNRYALRFALGQLPPVHAFWSLTMCKSPSATLAPNPLNRHALNTAMTPGFSRDADGGITVHLQHQSPGEDREANWLPAPAGPFSVTLRLVWPQPDALEHRWNEPLIYKTHAARRAGVARTLPRTEPATRRSQ